MLTIELPHTYCQRWICVVEVNLSSKHFSFKKEYLKTIIFGSLYKYFDIVWFIIILFQNLLENVNLTQIHYFEKVFIKKKDQR